MNKYVTLTKALLKSNLGLVSDGKTKKGTQVAMAILMGFSIFWLLFVAYFMFNEMFQVSSLLDQSGSILALGMFLCSFLIFMFSLFIVPAIYYFSKDSNTLLALPLKPETILASKFTVCVIYDYMFTFATMIPLFIAYAQNTEISIGNAILFFIITLTLPLTPLMLSSMIIMLIMRFVPFAKNRDLFNMVGGILTIVLALGFALVMNMHSYSGNGNDSMYFVNLVLSGKDSLIEIFTAIFPHMAFAIRAIVDADVLQALLYLGILAIAYAVFMLLAKWLYFKGVIGFSETGSSRKTLSAKEMKRSSKQNHILWTYTKKEILMLFRTPAYFVNCVIGGFVMPILFIGMLLFSDVKEAFTQIPKELIQALLPEALPWVIVAGLVYGLFSGLLSSISSTAISREGSNYIFMKYIPVSLKTQLHAKVLSALILSLPPQLILVVAIYYLVPYLPISLILVFIYTLVITSIAGNYAALYIDVCHPKLVWEQEAAAVKQNFTATIIVFVCMGLAALVGAGAYFFIEVIDFYAYACMILFTLLAIFSVLGIEKICAKPFSQL